MTILLCALSAMAGASLGAVTMAILAAGSRADDAMSENEHLTSRSDASLPDRSTPTTGVRSAQPHIEAGTLPPPPQRSSGDGVPEAAELARQLETALTDLGDFETMDQENADLRAQLAASEQRAETQLKRAERLAQAIMGLCEGDANDIEFELDLYPLDLYDQTGGGFVVPTSQDAAVGRTARLRKALHTVAAMADERGKRLSPYYPSVLGEDGRSELGLHPGDLDDPEATS